MEDILLVILLILNVFLVILGLIIFFVIQKNKAKIDDNLVTNKIRLFLRDDILELTDKLATNLNNNNLNNNNSLNDTKYELLKQIGEFKQSLLEKYNDVNKNLQVTIKENLDAINTKVETRLNEGFEKTGRTFVEIVETMTKIESAKVAIEKLNDEVSGLQNILNNNQSKGVFGEFQLNQILSNILGEKGVLYDTQYPIEPDKKGNESVRADVVVFLEEPKRLLCIDSKFTYASYSSYIEERNNKGPNESKFLTAINAQMKKNIDDIAKKYIIKDITTDYALLFVPSDGIFTLLHSQSPALIEYAFKKNIIIVSPTTLAPTLFSYKIMNLDARRGKKAKEIIVLLDSLALDFTKFYEEWTKLKKAMNSLNTHSESFDKKVESISRKFNKVSLIQDGEDVEEKEEQLC